MSVMLLIMLHKVLLTFESVDEILECNLSHLKATARDVPFGTIRFKIYSNFRKFNRFILIIFTPSRSPYVTKPII